MKKDVLTFVSEPLNQLDKFNIVWRCEVTFVDACLYSREGLKMALNNYCHGSRDIETCFFSTPDVYSLCGRINIFQPKNEIRCLVLRLSENPTEALQLLLQLGSLPREGFSRVIIMSTIESATIRRLLLNVGMNIIVYLVDSRLQPEALCNVILPELGNCTDTIVNQYEVLQSRPHLRFTAAERRVLMGRLQGISFKEQASQAGKTVKTIYSHQANALRKINVRNIPTLLQKFRPVKVKMTDGDEI